MTEHERPLQEDAAQQRYELWDTESGNIIGAYASEAEAIAIVREAITAHGPMAVQDWALGSMGDDEPQAPVIEGAALVDRAMADSSG